MTYPQFIKPGPRWALFLLRLWLAGSVVWAAFFLFMAAALDIPNSSDLVAAAILPPVIVFVIGRLLVWSARGLWR